MLPRKDHGPGNSIQDDPPDLTAELCRLDTTAATAGADAVPTWPKPLALARIVRRAAAAERPQLP
ncbi:MAG: hypothetical protein ACRD01_10565 [Terriglobales bacterium]